MNSNGTWKQYQGLKYHSQKYLSDNGNMVHVLRCILKDFLTLIYSSKCYYKIVVVFLLEAIEIFC